MRFAYCALRLQDNASPPVFFERRRVRLVIFSPLVARLRGSEAPQGAGAERRTRWPPYGWAGPLCEEDHRPITLTGAPRGASPRHLRETGSPAPAALPRTRHF